MAKVTELFIRHLVVEDDCPKCGKTRGTGWGSYEIFGKKKSEDELNADFWCEDCDYEWERDMTIRFDFGEVRDPE